MKRIMMYDGSEYVQEKSHNGGCYSYWDILTEKEDGNFVLECFTSSVMDFCPICGSFFSCGKCTCGEDELRVLSPQEAHEYIKEKTQYKWEVFDANRLFWEEII